MTSLLKGKEKSDMERALKKAQMIQYERVKKCAKCGNPMKYVYGEMYECPECGYKELSDFGRVREYLEKNGPQTAIIIAENTGVSIDEINRFLKEGRIEIPDGSSSYIHCQSCGAEIRYGRYCPECIMKLTKNIKGAIDMSQVGEKPRYKSRQEGMMHTLDVNKSNVRDRR